jgi:hypothetical protein
MAAKTPHKPAETATVDDATETDKQPNMVVAGVKKGALAAKQAASKIVSAPSQILDDTVYGVCYGLSYGAVFSSLMVTKMLPANGSVIKGFNEGAKVAHKDFKTQKQERVATEKHEPKHAAAKKPEPKHAAAKKPEPKHAAAEKHEPKHAAIEKPAPKHAAAEKRE